MGADMDSGSPSLLQLLDLELIDGSTFRGRSLDIGGKSVFGGQVLGQALAATNRTVEGRLVHSLHAYFLLPGDMHAPIDFVVERVRDGRSFSTRSAAALQHGRSIFRMVASYQVPEEGLEHQAVMPEVPAPEDLPPLEELAKSASLRDPHKFREKKPVYLPMEFRLVEPANPYTLEKRPPFQKAWFRFVEPIPDDAPLQRCALAYASDFALLHAASLPHGISFRQKNVHVASLDHAMWFHRPFHLDQWLLYVADSPSASNARGFAWGSIFTREGVLVASVAQEGLMRVFPEE